MSMNGTPTGMNEWGEPYSMFAPPQSQPTPPSLGGSGVWSPPTWNNMRNGSPAMPHNHSPGIWNGGYPHQQQQEPKPMYDQWTPYNPLVNEERFHQQQMRRGSPLAHPGYIMEEPEQQIREDLAIDAPIPKHRHQLSLKAYDSGDGYNHNERYQGPPVHLQVEDGFATNPVSPAPVNFPSQPEMPRMETDVHIGPEVASNPDEDISDEEEKRRNKQQFEEMEKRVEYPQPEYSQTEYPQSEYPQSEYQKPDYQQAQYSSSYPSQPVMHQYAAQQFPHPHSREHSLSQMQADYDAADPIQNSAMQMLMAGDGLSGAGRLRPGMHPEDLLSEDGRTNISDPEVEERTAVRDEEELTNPSEGELPARKYSTFSHGQHNSNASNHWAPDHTKNALSGTSSSNSKPKFNVNATEFKFDPAAASTFTPGNPFTPAKQAPAEDHTVVSPGAGFGGFGSGSYNTSFRPNLASTNTMDSLFAKSAAAFSKGTSPISPPPNAKPSIASIFGAPPDIIKPPATKKIIPIVRPPSRPQNELSNAADENRDVREGTPADGGRKRAKHSPTLAAVKNTNVEPLDNMPDMPEPAIKAAGEADDAKSEDDETSLKSDPAEIIAAVDRSQVRSITPYEFQNQEDAKDFAMAHPMGESMHKVGAEEEQADSSPEKAPRTPSPELPVTPAKAPISEEKHKAFKKLTFNPTAKSFSFRPSAPGQEFNFDFGNNTTPTAPARKFAGMGESRYAKTPSPPPNDPPPNPPVLGNGATYLPPRPQTPYDSDPLKFDDMSRPRMPTDAELDEVIKFMERADPIFAKGTSESESSGEESTSDEDADEDAEGEPELDIQALSASALWKRPSPRMGIPAFQEHVSPSASTPMAQRQLQALRSDGPSPSPRRVNMDQYARHRASSYSSESEVHAITADIGITKDVDSDWDDMVSEKGDGKLRPQSRLFFDSHVEELVGGLMKQKLDPVHRTLTAIQDILNAMSMQSPSKGFAEHSDADDEDDSSVTLPSKSPRDRKMDMMKAAVTEALAMHGGSAVSEESLNEIKDAIAANESSKEIAALKAAVIDVIDAMAKNTHGEDMAIVRASLEDVSMRVAQSTEIAEMKTALLESVARHAKADDVTAVKDSLAEFLAKAVQRVDLVDVKFALQDILVKTAQRSDIAEIKTAVANSLAGAARKEDLVPLHNVLAEAFEGTAKSEEMAEFHNRQIDILQTVLSNATNSTVQEVVKVGQMSDNVRATVAEVLRLTRDYSANMDFHQEAQQEMIKDAQGVLTSRSDNIQAGVTEIHKFLQSRASKGDHRKTQTEKELRENMSAVKAALAQTIELIQHGFQELDRTHPTIDDFRSVVERLAGAQPRIAELKSTFEEAVKTLPGLVDFKAIVEEVLHAQPTLPAAPGAQADVQELKSIIDQDREIRAEQFRAAVEKAVNSQPTIKDFETLLEHAFAKHQLVVPFNFGGSDDREEKKAAPGESAEELKVRVRALEKSLAQKEAEVGNEVQSKRTWEEKAIELEMKLQMVEEECERQRAKAEDTDRRLRNVDDKRQQALTSAQMRTALLEGAHSSLQKAVGDLSARNATLEATAREAQSSSERARTENEQLESENRELRRQIERVRAETEESIKIREGFRGKFDVLQEGMRSAALEFGQEQGKWRKTIEEQRAHIEVLDARLMAEATNLQGLQNEIRRLEATEKDAIRARVEIEQYQRNQAKFDEVVSQLRAEASENQSRIAQLSHEVKFAHESADKARNEVDRVIQDAGAEKERMELVLEEVRDQKTAELNQLQEQKRQTLVEAADAKFNALQEQQEKYENQLEEIREHNERAYRIATEDAEREQYFLRERLNMAQEEAKNLREHIATLQVQVTALNENFKIANVAAQAAAQAATAVREMSTPHLTDEKALRETVDVLQSQLQQREARIDELEHELAAIDKDKLREASSHLTMYRELLDMRIDDLEEIIHTCSLPAADRGALRDAATRLKASLDMQRHEQERAAGIIPKDPATSSPAVVAAANIANKASASAAAAWSNWRNRNANKSTPTTSVSGDTTTPSRPSSAAGNLLNGILTPPGTNLSVRGRFSRAVSEQPSSAIGRKMPLLGGNPAIGRAGRPMPQPQLFRKSSYDADADSSALDSGEFFDDEETTETETERGSDHRRSASSMSKASAAAARYGGVRGMGITSPYAS